MQFHILKVNGASLYLILFVWNIPEIDINSSLLDVFRVSPLSDYVRAISESLCVVVRLQPFWFLFSHKWPHKTIPHVSFSDKRVLGDIRGGL